MLPKSSMRMSLLASVALGAILCLPNPASAQQTGSSPPPAATSSAATPGMIEEIIVTARKQEENQQNVPVSVTAFSGNQLKELQIREAVDLQYFTPSLTVAYNTGSGVEYNMRGQGAAGGGAPSVVTYFAGAPAPIGGQPLFFDLANIQVLKGPQGTLFGQTSTGGAILFEPMRASHQPGGYIEARYGNLDYKFLEGAVNFPLVKDVLAVRIAGQFAQRDGYTEDVNTGVKYSELNRKSLRIGVHFTPTSWFTNDTLVQYTGVDEREDAFVLLRWNPAPRFNITAATFGAICGGAATANGVAASNRSAFIAGCTAQRLAIQGQTLQALAAEVVSARGGDVRKTFANSAMYERSDAWLFNNQATINFRDFGFLTGLYVKDIFSAPISNHSTNVFELDGTDQQVLDLVIAAEYQPGSCNTTGPNVGFCTPATHISRDNRDPYTYSNEVNVGGTLFGRLNLIGGHFYTVRKTDELIRNMSVTIANGTLFGDLRGAISGNTLYDRSREKGTFVQGTLDLSSVLRGVSVTAGKRWIDIGRDAYICVTFTCAATRRQTTEFSSSTYTLSADWRITDDVMVYVRSSTGFKPGGVNVSCTPSTCPTTYEPEELKDYEIGLKADWTLGGIAARTNLAAYSGNYNNIQKQVTPAGFSFISSAPRGKIKGIEIEQTMAVTDRYLISLGYSYVDAKYTRWFDSDATHPCTDVQTNRNNDCVDLSGSPFQKTPEHKFNVRGRYYLPWEDLGRTAVELDYSWQSKMDFGSSPLVQIGGTQKAYGVLNGRIDVTNFLGSKADVSIFAKNILDKEYWIDMVSVLSSIGINAAQFAEPRTYGVQLRYRFGQ